MKHTVINAITHAVFISGVVLLAGCADKAANIQPSYISPLMYKDYECDTLNQEYNRLIMHGQSVNKQQDRIANNYTGAVAASLLFWPTLFLIDNDDMREQVALIKGQLNAIQESAIQKGCMSAGLTNDNKLSQ
jgi:hypothetical protein